MYKILAFNIMSNIARNCVLFSETSNDGQIEDRANIEEVQSLKMKNKKLEEEIKRLKNQVKVMTATKTNKKTLDTSKG